MRKTLLARHLHCSISHLKESRYGTPHLFEYFNADYLILTNEEANQEFEIQLETLIYQLDIDFIKKHLKIDIPTEILQQYIFDMCDNYSCIQVFWELLHDKTAFLEDVAKIYGRGYVLGWYDGKEIEVCADEHTSYYIYRLN